MLKSKIDVASKECRKLVQSTDNVIIPVTPTNTGEKTSVSWEDYKHKMSFLFHISDIHYQKMTVTNLL